MRVARRGFCALVGGGLGAVAFAPDAHACIWDTDALEQEAAGAPTVVPTLAGGFARNPPKYYELRLARAQAELDSDPDALAAYDDAAVSCDRLGRHDEAIAWMASKREALERLGVGRVGSSFGLPNHWYRYHANLGTFHAHRWLKRPDRWDDVADLDQAHTLIGQAITDNPEAHFGREVYQLRALAWLRERPTFRTGAALPLLLADLPAVETEAAVAGLCGLITLGAAWNSFDITAALVGVLERGGKTFLAELGRQRCAELVAAGGRSLILGAPEGDALVELIAAPEPWGGPFRPQLGPLREGAEAWAAQRDAYLMARLERGEHPDTDPEFWAEFADDPYWLMPTSLIIPYAPDLYAPKSKVAVAAEEVVERAGCSCTSSADAGRSGLGLGLAALVGLLAVRRPRV